MNLLLLTALLSAPQVQIVVPQPAKTMALAEAPLKLIGRIERRLHPRALRRAGGLLGLDPLDAKSVEAWGVDLQKPVHLWRQTELAPLAASAYLARPEQLDRAIEAALKKLPKRVQRLEHPSWNTAALIRSGYQLLLVARIKNRLLIEQLSDAPRGKAQLDALAKRLQSNLRIRPPKGQGDIFIQLLKPDRVEAIDKASFTVKLKPKQAQIRGRLVLNMLGRLALGDALEKRGSQALLSPPDAPLVIDATARVGPSTLSAALLETGMTSAQAERLVKRYFDGRLHLQLTEQGGLRLALGLKKAAPKGWLESLPLVRQRAPNLKLELLQPKLLVASLGAPAPLAPLVGRAPPFAPWRLTVMPAPLFKTLMRLSNRRTGLGRGSSKLTVLRLLYGDLLGAVHKIEANAQRNASVITLDTNIDY